METMGRRRIELGATLVMTIAVLGALVGSLAIALIVDLCIDECADQPVLSWEAGWRILLLLGFCTGLIGLAWGALRAERRGRPTLASRLLLATLVAPVVAAVVWWFLVSIVH